MRVTAKQQSRWIRRSGWAFAVLGLIHQAAIVVVLPTLSPLPSKDRWAMVDMFLMTGAAVVFAGLLLLYCAKGLERAEPWARVVALGSGVFLLLGGIGSVVAMPDNPFAYLMLLLALGTLFPLLRRTTPDLPEPAGKKPLT